MEWRGGRHRVLGRQDQSLEAGDVCLTQFLIAEVESAKLGTGRSEDGDKGHREIF